MRNLVPSLINVAGPDFKMTTFSKHQSAPFHGTRVVDWLCTSNNCLQLSSDFQALVLELPLSNKVELCKKTNVNLFESCSQLKPSTLSPLRPFGGPNLELSEAPEKPSGALGEPHELQATEMQWGPLKCFVNRRKRHSRATSSQMYSANKFVDFPIAQTLEDSRSPSPSATGCSVGGAVGRGGSARNLNLEGVRSLPAR